MRIIAECCSMYARVNPQMEGKHTPRDRAVVSIAWRVTHTPARTFTHARTSDSLLRVCEDRCHFSVVRLLNSRIRWSRVCSRCCRFADAVFRRKFEVIHRRRCVSAIPSLMSVMSEEDHVEEHGECSWCRLSIFLTNRARDRASISGSLAAHERFRIIKILRETRARA